MNKLNIPKEQLISNSDMTKFVEDVLSDFYKDKDLVEFAKSYNFSLFFLFLRIEISIDRKNAVVKTRPITPCSKKIHACENHL